MSCYRQSEVTNVGLTDSSCRVYFPVWVSSFRLQTSKLFSRRMVSAINSFVHVNALHSNTRCFLCILRPNKRPSSHNLLDSRLQALVLKTVSSRAIFCDAIKPADIQLTAFDFHPCYEELAADKLCMGVLRRAAAVPSGCDVRQWRQRFARSNDAIHSKLTTLSSVTRSHGDCCRFSAEEYTYSTCCITCELHVRLRNICAGTSHEYNVPKTQASAHF